MLSLLELSLRLAHAANMIKEKSSLFANPQVIQLGESIREEVRSRHGDPSKISPGLSPITIAKKGSNSPLLETGELRDSYHYTFTEDALIIGSNNEKALWHEFGFTNARTGTAVPAREVLMPSVLEKGDEIQEAFGEAALEIFRKVGAS